MNYLDNWLQVAIKQSNFECLDIYWMCKISVIYNYTDILWKSKSDPAVNELYIFQGIFAFNVVGDVCCTLVEFFFFLVLFVFFFSFLTPVSFYCNLSWVLNYKIYTEISTKNNDCHKRYELQSVRYGFEYQLECKQDFGNPL